MAKNALSSWFVARGKTDQNQSANQELRTKNVGPTEQISDRRSSFRIWKKLFSFPVFLGALLIAGVLVSLRVYFVEGDAWWHINVGEAILRTHLWPTTESYSFTAHGGAWIAYEWLGEVVMASALRLGGLSGLVVLLWAQGGLLILLLYYYATLRSGNCKAGFVASAVLLPLVIVFLRLRPYVWGFIFLVIVLNCLERFRQGRQKALWALPPLFLIWVNTHGSFALGLFVLGLYWTSGLVGFSAGGLRADAWAPRQRRYIAAVFLLCVVALTITPYGTRLAAYPIDMAFLQPVNVASVSEWQPLGSYGDLLKFFLIIFLSFIAAETVCRPTHRVEDILLLLLAVYLALIHTRFLLLFVLVFAPLLAMLLSRWVPSYQAAKDRPIFNAVLLLLLCFGAAASFPSYSKLRQQVADTYPEGAVDYIRRHSQLGPMFHDYNWGGYLSMRLGPEHKVFIDGRGDPYERAGVLSDYLRITQVDPQTMLLLRKYKVRACLIERQAALATFLAASPEWHQVYADSVSVLFENEHESRSKQ